MTLSIIENEQKHGLSQNYDILQTQQICTTMFLFSDVHVDIPLCITQVDIKLALRVLEDDCYFCPPEL